MQDLFGSMGISSTSDTSVSTIATSLPSAERIKLRSSATPNDFPIPDVTRLANRYFFQRAQREPSAPVVAPDVRPVRIEVRFVFP